MPKVFISYSSKDSDFVRKLSSDLLRHQIPVWLDAYELAIGDSLTDQLLSGIEDCSFIIVILSAHYQQTPWTSKEFQAVLDKEKRDNKKYLIPVQIDDYPLSMELEDRIRIDMGSNYALAMKNLVRFFKDENIHIAGTPLSERQLIFNFETSTEVDILLLQNVLFDLHLHHDSTISRKQLCFTNLAMIDQVLAIAQERMDHWTGDQQLLVQFKRHSLQVEKLIDAMYRGMLTILNEYKGNDHIEFLAISSYWFLKAVTGSIYAYALCYLDSEEAATFGLRREEHEVSPFGSDSAFKQFYAVKDEATLNVFTNSDHYVFFADRSLGDVRDLLQYQIPQPFAIMATGDLVYKYLIPQNVFSTLFNERVPLMKDFEKYRIGIN